MYYRQFFLALIVFFHASSSVLYSLDMSLEEKVGQMLIVHFNGNEVNEDAKRLINEVHVGGIIYYNWANGLDSATQIRNLSTGLQEVARHTPKKIPLFITVDQEGGMVNRFKTQCTTFPANLALGQTKIHEYAKAEAEGIAQELLSVGVNLNYAPVLDINSNPENTIIGIRSFGSSPKVVTKFGSAALKGYKKRGLIAVIKHFPGHGDTLADSHDKLPVLVHSKRHLDKIELRPFKKLSKTADVIMTAHILAEQLDAEHPVTFSKKIIEGLLRTELGFKGVIMTDSLVMQGILGTVPSIEEAAIRSLLAGHDILLLGGKQLLSHQKGLELSVDDVVNIHHAIVDAVRSGRLSESQIDTSVERILKLKESYQIASIAPFDITAHEQLVVSNEKLAKKIAKQALVIESKIVLPLDVSQKKVLVVAPERIKQEINLTSLSGLGVDNEILYANSAPTDNEISEIMKMAHKKDVLIFISYDSWKFPLQQKLFSELQNLDKEKILIVAGHPQDANLFQKMSITMKTFSPVAVSLQAAVDALLTKAK